MHDDLSQRKAEHLDLAQRPEVETGDALFGCVKLVHRALPELAMHELDLRAELLGIPLRAPLMIVGMTGGTERAAQVNADLAQVAEEEGLAFGVGSMRVLLERPELLPTFKVAARPPVLLANLGAQQLVQRGPDAALRLVELLSADGICVHLNAAQELVQDAGDRDFRGCLEAIGQLAQRTRVLVKETGCGIGPDVARELWQRGVRAIDVSGAGGTSWPKVEQLRAQSQEGLALGSELSAWGIPTAACVASVRDALPEVRLVASGGLRSGIDAAKALALGADLAGFALPFVRAQQAGGTAAVRARVHELVTGLRAAMLLTGSRDVAALRLGRRVILEPLRAWIEALQ